MSFRDDRSPAAGASMSSQRIALSFNSSLSPDLGQFDDMTGPRQTFPQIRRESIELESSRTHPQPEVRPEPKGSSPARMEKPMAFHTSAFFVQEPDRRMAGNVREAAVIHNQKFPPPSFQQFGHQDTALPQKGKQLSSGSGGSASGKSGSGRNHPPFVSTHRSPNHRRPGLLSHQVTSAQPKLPKRTEPSQKPPAPPFPGPAKLPDRIHKSDHSSPVPLGDLDHSLKGSPLLFAHHPNGRAGERMVNRPMPSERLADPRSAAPLRPISRESNISKRRVDSSRLSFPFHGDETADLEKFGSAWNHYLQNHARRSENAAARMVGLENKLAEQTKSLREYTHKCNHQSAAITSLEKQVSDLTVQKRELTKEHQIAKQHLEQNEARREEMQTKLRSYREKLNEAIIEQQDLYRRSKVLCDSAIDDVRKTQKEAEEAQREATEMLEEGMNRATEARRETKALLEGELKRCHLLQTTVEKENVDLRQQLSEAQNELKCDKAKVQDLLSQLERERPTRDHLQTLESKSNEILLQLQQANSLLPANEETHQTMLSKLDVVLEQVQASALNTREYLNLKETLNGLVSQLDSTSSQLLADVRSVLTSQSSIVAMSGGLEKTIKDQLSSVNRLIKEQEEGLLNKLHDKDGKCQELTVRLAEKNSELNIAVANVQQLSRMADEKSQRVEELHAQVQDLQEISQKRNHLKLENKALLEQLSNKDSDNAALQMQFEDALSQNQARALELQNFTRQIADRLQEKGADAEDVSALRTKMACKLEVETSKLDEAKRVLQRCEEDKSKLGKDFIDIAAEKSKLSKELEELRAHRSEEASSLERTRVSLIQAEQRVVNLREKLKTSEFKTRDIQNALAQWAGKKMDGAELGEDFLDLDLDAMRILVRTIMDAHRESEAAKDCLRAVLEMPSSAAAEDTCRVSKPGRSPVRDQEGGATNGDASIDAGIAPATAEGVCLGIPSIDQTDQGGATEPSDLPLDTSRDSVRRIIVQSPFDEENRPTPPSVEEERMSRRRFTQPMSILKTTSAPASESSALLSSVPSAGHRGNIDTPALAVGPRPKSLPPTYRTSANNTAGSVAKKQADARAEGFLGKIKQSLGLQRTPSAESARKRKGSVSEEGNPAKSAKTWQSMFGTLDLEMEDLKSSYFPAPTQPRRAPDEVVGGGTPRLSGLATGGETKLNTWPRGAVQGQQGQRGKTRGVVRTYSKKPQEPVMG